MKRTFVIGFFGISGAVLLGCPVFSDNSSGVAPQCYEGNCGTTYCNSSIDCPSGYSCEDNYCVYGSGEASTDGGGDTSDCVSEGCPAGEQCTVVGGKASCVSTGDSATDGGGDTSPPFKGCTSNAECAADDGGAGSLCLNGACVPPANQCFDGTQCSAGEDCVQGACVPTCSASMTCPTGYSCNIANGVCTGNPTPCGGADGGTACTDGTTCVDQHCVPMCSGGSGGDASCGTGLICVDDGCIPNQKPIFTCNNDGVEGDGGAGNCDTGSICLHHSCFISCDLDATNVCAKTMFPICKAVTTSGGTYDVCGSSTNLGNQCDPTQGMNCSGSEVCIDGYCR